MDKENRQGGMTTSKLTPRKASELDVAFLTDVILCAHYNPGNHARAFTRVDQAEIAQWTLEHVRGDHPDSITSVIEFDGTPIGRHRVVRTPEDILLAEIQLLPEHRSHGYGTQLIRALMDEAASTGRFLRITVEKENTQANSLYQRLGFAQICEDEREYWLQWSPQNHRWRDWNDGSDQTRRLRQLAEECVLTGLRSSLRTAGH